jgi:hypothetical protein
LRRPVTDPIGVFDGELRLSAQELAVIIWLLRYPPDAAKAEEGGPRSWHSTLPVNLVQQCSALDKMYIATERHVR